MEPGSWSLDDLARRISELVEHEEGSEDEGDSDSDEGAESWTAFFGPTIKVAIIADEVEQRISDNTDEFKNIFETPLLRKFIRKVRELLGRGIEESELVRIVLPGFAAGLEAADVVGIIEELRRDDTSP